MLPARTHREPPSAPSPHGSEVIPDFLTHERRFERARLIPTLLEGRDASLCGRRQGLANELRQQGPRRERGSGGQLVQDARESGTLIQGAEDTSLAPASVRTPHHPTDCPSSRVRGLARTPLGCQGAELP